MPQRGTDAQGPSTQELGTCIDKTLATEAHKLLHPEALNYNYAQQNPQTTKHCTLVVTLTKLSGGLLEEPFLKL